jgi:hypothetical protein
MLIPFKGNELYVPGNEQFNADISRFRVIIEHLNGILKGRWASLNGIRTQIRKKEDCKKVNDWVRACLTLHNMMIAKDDEWDDYELEEAAVNEQINRHGDEDGVSLRTRIKAALNNFN